MTAPTLLEDAWQAFLCNDVAVATVLAFEEAALDGDALARHQRALAAGTPAERGHAADMLRRMFDEAGVKNALALDGLVAAGLDGAERWADALAVRVEALAVTARWHLLEAGRLVGNIGHDLLRLGRLEEARTWYERALAWDPANPFVVVGLAEVHLARGELTRAFAYRDHLDTAGYRASHAAEFDAAVERFGGVVRPPSGVGYQPDLGSLFALDEAGYARQCAALQHDRNLAPGEALRAHALASLMRGRAEHAYWVASLAAETPAGDGERGALELAWSQALRRAMTVRLAPAGVPQLVEQHLGGRFTPAGHRHDDEAAATVRLTAVDELAHRGDHAGLATMLCDPHPGLRLAAAAALSAAGDPRARIYLDEIATYERARGFDTWRPELGPTASRLRWLAERRLTLAGKPPLVIPEDGMENPGLAALEPGQILSVMMTFLHELDDAALARIQVAAGGVLERADWNRLGGEPRLMVERDDVSLHLALVKPPLGAVGKLRAGAVTGGDMRPLLRDLLAAVSSVEPFTEVMLARLTLPAEGDHCLQPLDDPRDDGTHDHDEIWEPSFDPGVAPPASEPEGGLFMMFPVPDGQLPERRNARLWLRDLRIVYGLPDVEHTPADARSADVAIALDVALRHVFRGLPPRFRDRHGRAGAVDAIRCDGRRGFAVAIDGLDLRFLVHYPGTSRFREYELFQAMRELCGAVGLRPVVHWYREGGLYVINCWEW